MAESGLDYNVLSNIYKEQKEEAKEVLSKKVSGSEEKDIEELIELLEAHFNSPAPTAKPQKPAKAAKTKVVKAKSAQKSEAPEQPEPVAAN